MSDNITIYQGHRLVRHAHLQFPGGEEHVRLDVGYFLEANAAVAIRADVRSSADLVRLLLVTDALRRVGANNITLEIPYLPYARQDRVCNHGEALSLRVICDLINAQNYVQVHVWDVHSDVAMALINRVQNIGPEEFLDEVGPDLIDWEKTILVAPDAGALKKMYQVSQALHRPFIRADKTRDPTSGQITGTVVHGQHAGKADFLIVDDICDGGRTFIELAVELRKLTNGRVMLYVTHGIFSRGTAVFDGLIDRVFYANSFVEGLPSNFYHLNKPRI